MGQHVTAALAPVPRGILRGLFARGRWGAAGVSFVFMPGALCMRLLRFWAKLALLAALMGVALAALSLPHLLGTDGWAGSRIVLGVAWTAAVLLVYLMACFHRSFMHDFNQTLAAMREVQAGNLSQVREIAGGDELARMSQVLARTAGSLSSIVADVRTSAALVEQAGLTMARGHRDLANRTEQQAASLQQTSASVKQLACTVQQNAQTAGQSDRQAGDVRASAEGGAQAMGEAVRTVGAIQEDTRQMRELVGVIDDLAFQTNILALNAAVEAARAGEQGRGFAVVATEVRRLAQRCGDEARQIRQLIETSATHVDESVERIRAAGGDIARIVEGVRHVARNMSQISMASAEQSTGLGEIAQAVAHLDSLTQSNAHLVEEAANQAVYLKERAATLSGSVAHFRLMQGTASEALRLVEQASAAFRSRGRDDFLRGVTNPVGGFHDRDMYVFALDARGTYLAFGGNPAKVGTRVQDIQGVNGDALLAAIVRQADREAGWVEYDITNPLTRTVQTKMSYVLRLGDLYVGCGVYKSLQQAKAA